jgi:hypothetical protein
VDKFGGRTRTRTWDPLIKSQLLYQLSYAPETPAAVEPARAASCSKAGSHCPAKRRRNRALIACARSSRKSASALAGALCVRLCVPNAAQRETKWSHKRIYARLRRAMAALIRDRHNSDGPGSAAHHFASLVLRCAQDTAFHNRVSELHKRKAAGWGPGGSRTSAIVSGGWECDRRR